MIPSIFPCQAGAPGPGAELPQGPVGLRVGAAGGFHLGRSRETPRQRPAESPGFGEGEPGRPACAMEKHGKTREKYDGYIWMYHGIMDADDGFVWILIDLLWFVDGIVWMYHGFMMEIA